jgi:hypothetical protein
LENAKVVKPAIALSVATARFSKRGPNAGCSAANHSAKKILKFEGTQPCWAEKIFHYFWIPTSQSTTNLKKSKTAQELRFSFYKKKKSKAISLKSHIRGRNPLYRRKPEFGKKVLGIQGNQPCPAKKSSHYFLDSHQRNPAFFQNPKTATKLQFSVFFSKKKTKKTSPILKKTGLEPPLPTLTEVYWKAPIKKKTFCWLIEISFFFAFWTRGASLTI